ncbi:MAG: tyrosine-type recombinase/integrase [bacterium]
MSDNNSRKVLTKREQERLLSQINRENITGERNYLLIKLILNTGLRLSPICNLTWNQVDLINNIILLKDNKRRISLDDELVNLLSSWNQRQLKELGENRKFIFTSMSKGVKGKRISKRYVQDMIKRYAEHAEINKNVSPKILRYTYAYNLYQDSKSFKEVKEKFPSSSLDTINKYFK